MWRATPATSPRRGALYGDSLRLFREAGDEDGVATALADLARLAREDGDLRRRARCCKEVLAIGSIGRRAMVRVVEELAALAAATGDAAARPRPVRGRGRAAQSARPARPGVEAAFHVADDRRPAGAGGTRGARAPGAGGGT